MNVSSCDVDREKRMHPTLGVIELLRVEIGGIVVTKVVATGKEYHFHKSSWLFWPKVGE